MLDRLLFGRHALAVPLQRVMQKVLRGPRRASFQFKSGPAKGRVFHCLTSNRYFFVRDSYEAGQLEPITRFVKLGSVAYDIGGHYGYWAVILSHLCGPTGKVFAFEPSPRNREFLALNVQGLSNVEVVPFAVSDRDGIASISFDGSMSKVGSGSEEVRTMRLDTFCQSRPKPDFLMVDVEGFGPEVIAGASELLKNRSFPVIFEVHDRREEQAVGCKVLHSDSLRAPFFPYHVSIV